VCKKSLIKTVDKIRNKKGDQIMTNVPKWEGEKPEIKKKLDSLNIGE
jgi:hypothetical protein